MELLQRQCATYPRLDVPAIDRDRPGVAVDGGHGLPEVSECDSAIDQRDDITRVDCQHLLEAAQRRVDALQVSEHQPAVVERGDVARVKLKNFAEVSQRLLRIAAIECGAAFLQQRLHVNRHREIP